MSTQQLSKNQIKLADLIIAYIVGSAVYDDIIEMIGREEWESLNNEYGFSRDPYNFDNDEYEIVRLNFPNI